jgi:hypothetical protein
MATLLKHTVKPSGGDYTTLAAAIAHLVSAHANLVTADVYAEIEISGTWSSADTSGVDSTGITSDATRYLHIYTSGDARHGGVYSTGKYMVSVAGVAVLNGTGFVRLDGLQLVSSGGHVIDNGAGLTTSDIRISNCIIRSTDNSGIYDAGNSTLVTISNCVIYDTATGIRGVFFGNGSSALSNVFNCTFVGYDTAAVHRSSGTVTLTNNLFSDNGVDVLGTVSDTYCATTNNNTKGLSALGTGNRFSQTFTFVSAADFHLQSTDAGAIGYGLDLSVTFTTDIDGDTRPTGAGTWDIGADEYVSAVVAPTVTTTAITSILGTSATSGGTVTDTGGEDVTAQGVCWSTSTNPTVADSHTDDIADPSPFASSITGLTANTVYHVRAYATNSAGTGYGSDVQFETDVVPTLAATTAISKITHATASSGGNVTADGGATVTARGVCWNTSTNPTTANSKTTDAGTTGSFTSAITGLSPATAYHVRSYATNSIGTTYGTEVDFTTDTLSDISDAVFTVTEAATLPVVTSLSDTTVYAGESITITGTTFGATDGYVKFGALTALVSSWADTSIVCIVPASVIAGNLTVITSTLEESAGTAYTVLAPAGITSGGSISLGMSIGI